MAEASENSVRLILASASPDRRRLLQNAGFTFSVQPADIEEPRTGFSDPRAMVQSIAWLKAAAIAPQVEAGIVLAADTLGWLDGAPLLKPTDEADARRMLTAMGGRDHELWTGVVLWRRPDNLQVAWQERSLVRFRQLDAAELNRYLASRAWMNHSGGYAIQDADDPHVRVVDGSISNVIGLPMETLLQTLSWFHG